MDNSLRGRLYTYRLNPVAVDNLNRAYDMFVLPDETKANHGFRDAMESFRATYLERALPRPYEGHRAVLLPRAEPRSSTVASILRDAG